ncbi:hypothetical protein BDN72DRAFT_597172 [Pluteus cervinus]|uniref:Uncharacterized protein n=1 Tax=Pluteus cervinus TaxID=181527 RepID=A0ACD3A0Y9_9AGAR|nr:hypothetical protein BDN72DRAFT_597172 [Pluteus cervinus]
MLRRLAVLSKTSFQTILPSLLSLSCRKFNTEVLNRSLKSRRYKSFVCTSQVHIPALRIISPTATQLGQTYSTPALQCPTQTAFKGVASGCKRFNG